MLKIEHHTSNLLELTIADKLDKDDFETLATQADALITQYGTLRILINASAFNGWHDLRAVETHFGFVKNHHQKVERLAIIAGHQWQHWLASAIKLFLHPEIKVFNKDETTQARSWILQ